MPSSAGTFLIFESLINVLVEKFFIVSFASTKIFFKPDTTFNWAAKRMIWGFKIRMHFKGCCTLANFLLADKISSLVVKCTGNSDKSATRPGLC